MSRGDESFEIVQYMQYSNVTVKSPEQLCSPVQEENGGAGSQYEWILGSHYFEQMKSWSSSLQICTPQQHKWLQEVISNKGENSDDE